MRSATIIIDTQALRHNLAQVKIYAPNAKILAMVKANAYGHGVANCLPALAHADGVGVASYDEAKQLRLLGWDKPIVMIEGAFSEAEWQYATKFEIACVIHHAQQLDWALKHMPERGSPSATVWLKLNTGMNRLGFIPDQVMGVAQKLHQAGYQIVLTSHFANADDKHHPLNEHQINTFSQVLSWLRNNISPNIKGSLCNSAGLINFPEHHYDWVRPGIMLYGGSPVLNKRAEQLSLRPVMTVQASLMAIHPIAQGDSIGYGSRFVASTDMVKGIISFGYGDGYPRVVDDSAWVALHHDGHLYRCPILGRVSMDMIAIDITDVPDPQVGSEVTLWGGVLSVESHDVDTKTAETIISASHGSDIHDIDLSCVPSVDDVAASANTIGYELLCRVTQRPTRRLIPTL